MRIGAVALSAWVAATSACAAPAPPAAPPAPAVVCPGPPARAVDLANEADRLAPIDSDAAIAKYEEALQLAPDDARILLKAAKQRVRREDWNAAARLYRRATGAAPEFASAWFGLGYALEHGRDLSHADLEEARAAFEQCAQRDPNFADCHEHLGKVRLGLDDEAGALASYSAAIRADPSHLQPYALLADLYFRLDLLSEARVVLARAHELGRPKESTAWVPIDMLDATVAGARGDAAAEIAALEAAKAHADPASPEGSIVLFALGSRYATLAPPRRDEARQLLHEFNVRVCKGARARAFRLECETTMTLMSRLEVKP